MQNHRWLLAVCFCAHSSLAHRCPVQSASLRAHGVGATIDEFIANINERHSVRNSVLDLGNGTGEYAALKYFAPDRWADRYASLGTKIGNGEFGAAYLIAVQCTSPSKNVVIKALQRIQQGHLDAMNELSYMNTMSHPNVMKAFSGSEFDPPGKALPWVSIVMEHSSGGDFLKLNKAGLWSNKKQVRRRLFYEALAGLEHMHSQGVVHSDIKQDNIFISEDCSGGVSNLNEDTDDEKCHAKIADLGFACDANTKKKVLGSAVPCNFVAGSLVFMAPELLRVQPNWRTTTTDMWSFGVMLHDAWHGRPPKPIARWEQELTGQAFTRSLKMLSQNQVETMPSTPLGTLLAGLLTVDTAKRMTAKLATAAALKWVEKHRGSSAPTATPSPDVIGCIRDCTPLGCVEHGGKQCRLSGGSLTCCKSSVDSVTCEE